MESIYQDLTLDKIPWNLEQPPKLLVELVESGRIPPCDAVDLGCGAGNHAVWLASRGFRVTGIDLSPRAVELAAELAGKKGVHCRFLTEDLLEDPEGLCDSFDFAFDWEVLHHIFPEDREKYVDNVRRMLRPGGRYLSVCFCEEDTGFGGEGKYRKTPLDTVLYFSSKAELKELFESKFHIQELYISEIEGKVAPHVAAVALMERK
jgi:SAM-dependent methyltransferase